MCTRVISKVVLLPIMVYVDIHKGGCAVAWNSQPVLAGRDYQNNFMDNPVMLIQKAWDLIWPWEKCRQRSSPVVYTTCVSIRVSLLSVDIWRMTVANQICNWLDFSESRTHTHAAAKGFRTCTWYWISEHWKERTARARLLMAAYFVVLQVRQKIVLTE